MKRSNDYYKAIGMLTTALSQTGLAFAQHEGSRLWDTLVKYESIHVLTIEGFHVSIKVQQTTSGAVTIEEPVFNFFRADVLENPNAIFYAKEIIKETENAIKQLFSLNE